MVNNEARIHYWLPLETCYLAGIFDSDGSCSISKHTRKDRRRGYDFRVYVQLTWRETRHTRRVLQEIRSAYGGSVFTGLTKGGYSTGSRYVKYVANAKNAAKLLEDILPYLRIKYKQAEICYRLAAQARAGQFNRWHPHSKQDWRRLEAAYNTVRRLNWKNGKGNFIAR